MTQKAAFQLDKYLFSKVNIDIDNKGDNDMKVEFIPSGAFIPAHSQFEITFVFKAFYEEYEPEKPYVVIECKGLFVFENIKSIDEIPSFFYRNAIAILFPYLRAFVSMVTLQANLAPVVLPTLNLSDLEQPLKDSTITL
ncbi:protein-export chaperone SecB [Flavobacterium sp. TR2]|uniref:protein-export chaperone SecB n=1 Tax=Flavobacterium sp. TR2 TaxID=2977321 RepID=UPI0021B15468|nr:protein-export chaperone SecB [Flavobacterium sp. TR2]UWY29372.1 protein-export chaperone SecB [Flavobacterium sp. TR2]